MISRRMFLKSGAMLAAGALLPKSWLASKGVPFIQTRAAYTPPPLFDPLITDVKYQLPLVIPPAMPTHSSNKKRDSYKIAVRQFQQEILPGFLSTVWGYGSTKHPQTFNYPSFTIEATHNRPVRIKWMNELVNRRSGNFLPHLFTVDPTLHWANPPGPRDSHPHLMGPAQPYRGPVPFVTHVHGAHVSEESDGYPEAWYLPDARNIPAGYFREGTYYDIFKQKFLQKTGETWSPGSATFQYPNDQRATTLWYHDHTLGMTRLNVYAGPAGFYIVRGGPDDLPNGILPGPYPRVGDPAGTRYYEIPIAIQDRSFTPNGQLWFPDSRAYFDGYEGPYMGDAPDAMIPPFWNPEFFGNTMVVNGKAWPYLNVERRRYRLRFLNGCNSRFLILRLTTDPVSRPATTAQAFWMVGAEGGFLPQPVALETLLMSPAERADVVVDFSVFPEGTEVYLINEGPDEPFGGGEPDVDFDYANPLSTGQVMKFNVGPAAGEDTSINPATEGIALPALSDLGAPAQTRRVYLHEHMHGEGDMGMPVAALLGADVNGQPTPLLWMDPVTENPAVGSVEEWSITNFTADAHPIHIHQVMFRVVGREGEQGMRLPEASESGWKDTVVAYPGETTYVRARFDLPGLFVWHCHIVDHEDNEMMRPYYVGPIPPGLPNISA